MTVNKKGERAGADDWVMVNRLVDHISVSYQNEQNVEQKSQSKVREEKRNKLDQMNQM